MIRIDPVLGVGLFFTALLLGIFGVWLLSWAGQRNKKEDAGEMPRLRRCPYCGHAFTDYLAMDIVVCPLCKSYLEGHHGA